MSGGAPTDDELRDLTGYEIGSKQVEVLRAMGLRPLIRPDGRPRVTWDALTAAMTGQLQVTREPARPNFDAGRRRA